MIKALGADRLASLTAQRYTGGPLPVPADRPDALRLVIPLDQLDALCLSAAGPRLRVETVGTDDLDGLPGLDVNILVAGGLTELGLALPAELTGAGWVRLVSRLATARDSPCRFHDVDQYGAAGRGLLVPAVLPSAVAATPNPTPAAGARKSATQLHYGLSATASASVDVATGNVLVTDHYSPCRASHRVESSVSNRVSPGSKPVKNATRSSTVA